MRFKDIVKGRAVDSDMSDKAFQRDTEEYRTASSDRQVALEKKWGPRSAYFRKAKRKVDEAVVPSSVATNTGASKIKGIDKVESDSKEDMDAFDQLGPKTRAVINDMPVKWSSHQTLQMIRKQGMHPVNHDDMIARHLSMAADQIRNQVRVAEAKLESDLKVLSESLR